MIARSADLLRMPVAASGMVRLIAAEARSKVKIFYQKPARTLPTTTTTEGCGAESRKEKKGQKEISLSTITSRLRLRTWQRERAPRGWPVFTQSRRRACQPIDIGQAQLNWQRFLLSLSLFLRLSLSLSGAPLRAPRERRPLKAIWRLMSPGGESVAAAPQGRTWRSSRRGGGGKRE